MRRWILGTAATGIGLFGIGFSTPAFAQDTPTAAFSAETQAEVAAELNVPLCSEMAPPCLADDNMVLLQDGSSVTPTEAYEALGIAAPESMAPETMAPETMAGDDVDGGLGPQAPPATVGEEAASDIENAEVIEENNLAEALQEETLTTEMAPDVEAAPVPIDEKPFTEEAPSETLDEAEINQEPDAETNVEMPQVGMDDAEAPAGLTDDEASDSRVAIGSTNAIAVEDAAGEAKPIAMTEADLKAQAEAEAEAAAKDAQSTQAVSAGQVGAEQEVDVQTETVTQDTARTSSEEFAKAPDKATDKITDKTTDKASSKDDDMSNLQKFLIGGCGRCCDQSSVEQRRHRCRKHRRPGGCRTRWPIARVEKR